MVTHYQRLDLQDEHITAEAVKNSYLGLGAGAQEEKMTLNKLVASHNEMMQKVLERGTRKNYYSTAIYLKNYMAKKYPSGDIYLKDLSFSFITGFEFYIRNNPLKAEDPCTNNGTMKHLERLKKMVTWAETNEWIDKSPFTAFKLKFKRHEMEFLQEDELSRIENRDLEDPCYGGPGFVHI